MVFGNLSLLKYRVPVETARKLASHLNLEIELAAILANDINVLSEDEDSHETPAVKRRRTMDNTEHKKADNNPQSKANPNKNPPDRRTKVQTMKISQDANGLRNTRNQKLETKRSLRSQVTTPETKAESPKVQLAAYNGKDVYEIKCNNGFVLRRVSDGWVNATTIFNASSIDKAAIAEINVRVPEPKEVFSGNKPSKLHGMWYVFLYSCIQGSSRNC
jgi:hypothetical protein